MPAEEHPADLKPIPWDQLGDSPAKRDNGDLILQICSDSVYINEHVLRRAEEELGDFFSATWPQTGSGETTAQLR